MHTKGDTVFKSSASGAEKRDERPAAPQRNAPVLLGPPVLCVVGGGAGDVLAVQGGLSVGAGEGAVPADIATIVFKPGGRWVFHKLGVGAQPYKLGIDTHRGFVQAWPPQHGERDSLVGDLPLVDAHLGGELLHVGLQDGLVRLKLRGRGDGGGGALQTDIDGEVTHKKRAVR